MASIINYGTLSAAVQNFMLDRTDLAAPMADLISLAEHAIYYGVEGMEPLRAQEMETIATLTSTSGVAALPDDYLQWITLVSGTAPRRELDYIAPSASNQQYPSRSGGLGDAFTMVGRTVYTFPLVTGDLELIYYARPLDLDAISTSSTNALLLKYPAIYLRATCAMAAEWMKNDIEMQKQLALTKALIGAVNKQDMMSTLSKTGITFRRQVR